MEAAVPVDGRANIALGRTPSTAADHRNLEIPAGFPQLPQALLLDFDCHHVKIRMGLGDPDPCS